MINIKVIKELRFFLIDKYESGQTSSEIKIKVINVDKMKVMKTKETIKNCIKIQVSVQDQVLKLRVSHLLKCKSM